MGWFVIVAYRPHPGQEERLLEPMREHLPILRSQGLATDPALARYEGHGWNNHRSLRVEVCRGDCRGTSEPSGKRCAAGIAKRANTLV
jgi:hypothetical protein